MAPEIHAVARATQTWLQTSWSIQVPSAWLEACVEWLQEEAGGPDRLLQQQVNQQVGGRFAAFHFKRIENEKTSMNEQRLSILPKVS